MWRQSNAPFTGSVQATPSPAPSAAFYQTTSRLANECAIKFCRQGAMRVQAHPASRPPACWLRTQDRLLVSAYHVRQWPHSIWPSGGPIHRELCAPSAIDRFAGRRFPASVFVGSKHSVPLVVLRTTHGERAMRAVATTKHAREVNPRACGIKHTS